MNTNKPWTDEMKEVARQAAEASKGTTVEENQKLKEETLQKINVLRVKESLPPFEGWSSVGTYMKRNLNLSWHRASNPDAPNEKEEQPLTPEEEIEQDRVARVERKKSSDTGKKYKVLLERVDRLEAEKEAILQIKEGTKAHCILPSESSNTSEATIVAIASDWHVEEEVKSAKVNGMNKYNLDIAKFRADQFFQRFVRLLRKEQQDVKITNAVLGLLGDFITGRIHEENLENCLLLPMEAILYAQDLLRSGLYFLLNHTELCYTVVCHVGNHSRITKKVHASTEQGNALEYFMYVNLQNEFEKLDPEGKRIKFVIAQGYHSYLDIYGKTHRFHHGHSIRYAGGVGGLTIPVNKAIAQWNTIRVADWDAFGHHHTYMPMNNFVGNGSLIGVNPFGISIKAPFEPPKQALYLIDKKRGKTVHIPILFDK